MQIKVPISPEGKVQLNTQAEHLEMSTIFQKQIIDHFGIEKSSAGYFLEIKPVGSGGHLYLIEKAKRVSQKKLDNFAGLLFKNGRGKILGTLYENRRHGDLKNTASLFENR